MESLGLKSWSDDNHGFHYTIIYSIIFMMFGWFGAIKFLSDTHPKIVKRIPILLVALLFFAPGIINMGVSISLANSDGINAIDYYYDESSCNYESDEEIAEITHYNYHISLMNHGKEKVDFYLKVELPKHETMINVTEENNKESGLRKFTLRPGEKKKFNFTISLKNDKYMSLEGSMRSPKAVIFNGQGEKIFSRN
ncbi:hypothetical protein [Desulfolucanica intricata]|uniref:hypothetical protein n=1 Tax=Desulfolucanica intricata TaxID=1285191 RepID=UPI000AE6C339|nr:hypothetical protein [Desulfolucanica intricata]